MTEASEELKGLFDEYFAGYVYPHEDADEERKALGADRAEAYYRHAKDIVESDVWQLELRGMLRHYFSHLAFKAKGEVAWSEQDAYRLTLIMLQEFDRRLRTLAGYAKIQS